MKRRIKVAAFIRVALLIGPGICYYLFTNTFINNENKGDSPTSDGKYLIHYVRQCRLPTFVLFSLRHPITFHITQSAECQRSRRT